MQSTLVHRRRLVRTTSPSREWHDELVNVSEMTVPLIQRVLLRAVERNPRRKVMRSESPKREYLVRVTEMHKHA